MIEGISNALPNSNMAFAPSDADSYMNSLQATNLQTQKNQKDKMAQRDKLNETLLSILCETIECTFCNILKSSRERLIQQNDYFEQRMQRIRNG